MLPRAEHVWITDVRTFDDQLSPGLLLGWKQTERGEWVGWVISATPGIPAHGDGPYVRQGWVRAANIKRRDPDD